jgi:hypothetical protein
VTREAHDKARAILAALSGNGWSSFGIGRTDPPSLTAVIEEAINCLAARNKRA